MFIVKTLMKITKNRYLKGFTIIVIVLALVRIIFPSVAKDASENTEITVENEISKVTNDTKQNDGKVLAELALTNFYDADYNELKNRINSVPNYNKTFPDNQDVQIRAASRYGVSPVENRSDAEQRKSELVYVGANPYYHIDRLQRSIPYLVPRAAVLLNDIGRAFFDSLQVKGVPLHQIIVTSVLRSRDDIKKLRNYNTNATENSCHLYGTTFDICYNRYKTVSDPDSIPRRAVRNDTLKWVLSEVLRDMRQNKRCYIKYEVKQGCFHITVR